MSDEMLSYLRIATVVLSITYAIWQHVQKRKLENFIANKAIALNKTISIILGAAQAGQASIANNASPQYQIGRVEGLSNSALIDSADLYCNLKKTSLNDIQEMVDNQQIDAQYQSIFNTFSNRKIGFIRKVLRGIARVY